MPTPLAVPLAALLAALLAAMAPPAAEADEPTVIRGPGDAVDGGTLVVDGVTLRLAGIVAPGPRQKCLDGNLPWLCGAAARQHLRQLIGGREVQCRSTAPGIAGCRVADQDLAAAMVRDGWAVADRDGEAYRDLEAEARKARRGLWEKTP